MGCAAESPAGARRGGGAGAPRASNFLGAFALVVCLRRLAPLGGLPVAARRACAWDEGPRGREGAARARPRRGGRGIARARAIGGDSGGPGRAVGGGAGAREWQGGLPYAKGGVCRAGIAVWRRRRPGRGRGRRGPATALAGVRRVNRPWGGPEGGRKTRRQHLRGAGQPLPPARHSAARRARAGPAARARAGRRALGGDSQRAGGRVWGGRLGRLGARLWARSYIVVAGSCWCGPVKTPESRSPFRGRHRKRGPAAAARRAVAAAARRRRGACAYVQQCGRVQGCGMQQGGRPAGVRRGRAFLSRAPGARKRCGPGAGRRGARARRQVRARQRGARARGRAQGAGRAKGARSEANPGDIPAAARQRQGVAMRKRPGVGNVRGRARRAGAVEGRAWRCSGAPRERREGPQGAGLPSVPTREVLRKPRRCAPPGAGRAAGQRGGFHGRRQGAAAAAARGVGPGTQAQPPPPPLRGRGAGRGGGREGGGSGEGRPCASLVCPGAAAHAGWACVWAVRYPPRPWFSGTTLLATRGAGAQGGRAQARGVNRPGGPRRRRRAAQPRGARAAHN